MNWKIRVWLGWTEWHWRRREGDPHQHSFLDVRFPGTPERDHSRLSKGEGGLVFPQPYALLQLQEVWTHEPTLQGCCEVYGLWKISMKDNVRDPSCALISVVPTLHRLKIARSGRRRRRFNVSALRNACPFRKPDSWLKPRCWLWPLEVRPTLLPLPPEKSPNLFSVKPR